MIGSPLTRTSIPSEYILPDHGRNVAHHHIGVVGAAELQDVPLGNRVVLDHPIAFGFDLRQPPEGVRHFAAANALKIYEVRPGGGDFAESGDAVGHAANPRRVVGRPDDDQFVARPWPHVDADAVRLDVGGDVARSAW